MGSSQMYNDPAQIDAILKKGYPLHDELAGFPLGKDLKDLNLLAWTRTSRPIKLKKNELNYDRGRLEQSLRLNKRLLDQEKLGDVYHHHIKDM